MKIPDDIDVAAAQVAGQQSTDPIDVAARQIVDTQRTQAKSSLYNALMQNPDMAARAQKLGRQTGLPSDVVERNMPEVERNVVLGDMDRLLANSPTVAQWVADPKNAAVSHDDLDKMGAIESALRYVTSAPQAPRGGLMSDLGKAGMIGLSGLQGASADVVRGVQAPFDLAAPLLDPLVGNILPGNPLRGTAQGLAKYGQSIDALAKANTPKADNVVEAGVISGLQSLTTNLATLPMAFFPGGQAAALTGMVLPVVGGAYGEARDKNIAPIQALTFGVSQGAIEYATERVPLARLIGDLKVGAPLYKMLANQIAKEVPGEQVATILQDLNEWAVLNPGKPFADYIAERPSAAAQTLIATIVGVGGQVSVVKGIEAAVAMNENLTVEQGGQQAVANGVVQTIMENALQMRLKGAQVEVAERDAQAITQLTELVRTSKLAQRDPVAFGEFVKQAAQDGPVQDVYINAQTFAQAAQEAGLTEQQLPEGVRTQLAEALATGGDLRIPIEEFASQIAPTKYAEALIDHMKVDPMGMSRAEAQVFMQTQVEQMQADVSKALAERDQDVQFKTSIDQVRTEFTEQLAAANRFTPEVNAFYANMLANFMGVMAAKSGMTPVEFAKRYPLRVQAEGVEGAAATFDQTKAPERDLVVTHNLTADNLLFAQRMGGIAVPSLAITKKDTPLTGFGEITLIGDEKMADPKGYASTRVFGADIYSPRYPSVERELDNKGVAALTKKFRPMADRMGESLPGINELQRDGQRELERSLPVMGQFLSDQGIEPELTYRPSMTPEREARLVEFGMGAFLDVTDTYALREDPAFVKAALAELIDTYEALDGKRDVFVQKLKTDEATQRNMVRDTAAEVANAAKLRQRPEVDRYATQKAMEAQVKDNELGNQFQQYVADLLDGITKSERIFQGFTYSGNRKYIPHTLENVVKLLKKELRGGERFNYGVGSLRAQFTPQFKSVAQIKANKDRLISAEQFEEVKKEIDAEFLQVVNAISPDLSLDTGVSIMEDAAKKGVVRAAKEYGYDVGEVEAAQVAGFLDKLRNLPTAYFEAKILREVDLAEFAGAVVPEGVDPKVIEALQARGVKDVKTYKKGDELDRAAKIGEFENLFFQGTGNRGQIAFGSDITEVPSIITLLKGADLSTFLHESGHFFLEVQLDLASRIAGEAQMFGADTNTPGQQQILADTSALLDWFGVKSVDEWFNLPMEEKRSYHEKFARGFESYLFEGKAPSIELQGMFQRFRAWLLRVYKDLKALNVELTDEVRGVMDRMLATTEQIELAEKGRSMLPLFTAPEQAGMTTDEFAAYQELGTEATQDAIQDLQGRTLRDMQWMRNARGREIKRLQKESAARRAEVTMEARRELMSQPVYQAWQFLTNRIDENDKAAMAPEPVRKSKPGPIDPEVDSMFVAIAKLGGLDRAQVESLWGWDRKERSPMPIFGKYLLRREGGMGVDSMGEMLAEYGYLPKDKNDKYEQNDFEDKFDAEYRGEAQYAYAKDYTQAMGEKLPGEDADIDNMGGGRLDLYALKNIGVSAEIVQIMENLKMTAKDGIHPDLVAESFGFTSGDELVRTLAIAEAPKVAIEGLADQKMLEQYGDLASPEAIERAADAAIHNDTRARFVATELNALAKATGKPKVLASAAREYAKAMIDRLLVRNVKPSQYAAAEVRAAKAAEKAMKAGDTAQAGAEKRNQLINTYATKSAHEALAEVEKGLRYLKKFNVDGTRKALDVDYLDQIDGILERFDLRAGASLKSIDKRKALAKWIDEQEDLGIEVELPEKVAAEAFRQSYKDLSVEEFRGLVESIKQIEHLGRLKEKLLTARDNRAFADVIASMVASVEENAGDKKANNRTRDTLGNRAVNLFKGFLASHRKVASLARELDGFKDAGPVWTYLIRTMNEAGDREATMRADATMRLTKLLEPVLAEGRMGGKGQFFPTVAESLNRGEQLVMALNMGNDGNIQRLLDGRGWTLEQVVPVMQNLSAADWRFVQSVWDFFESYRPEIAAKERRVMGKEPAWVEPRQLEVLAKGGEKLTLRGGYFPIVYDARESGRAEQQADAEAARQQMKGAFVAATTRRSFTKTRAEAVTGRPLVLTWDALFRGVNDVIHDLAWHEWVIDANRIVKNESLDRAIRSTYGADVVQQFKASIRDIAAGDAPNQDALSRVLTPLRTGAAVAGLGFNLMNAMLQPLGLTQSMVRVGPRWVAQGIAEWAKSPVGLVRQVHEKSEFMRNRARTMQRELNEIQSVVQGKSEARAKLDALMFAPMQSLQLVADMPTWWGAYQKALAQTPLDVAPDVTEDLAIKLADQAVLDAQSGGQVKDLALIQRGGPMQKLFTVFYGYFSAAYNLGVERTKATNFRSPLEVMHLAGDFLLLYSVPAVLAALMKSALQPGGDDEEELARKLIGEQISYMMGLLVGVRELTGAVQYATGTKQFDMAYGGPAGLRFFQELDKLGKQVGQGEMDRALARSVVNVGGVMLHLPSAQINRTIDGVIGISEGKTDNPAALLFGVEK